MHHPRTFRSMPVMAVAFILVACSDVGELVHPKVDVDPPPNTLMSVACTASLQSRTVSCGGAGLAGGVSAALIGGQNTYVTLESSNIQILADTFAFDVTVRNLIPQPLGTTNGTSAHSEGVRVAFISGPTSTGAGTVTVANPDGVGTFSASNQPYFQYAGLLGQGNVTASRQWKLQLGSGATDFTFMLAVSAEVQYPNGYILDQPYVVTLDPGEMRTLGGTVYSLVGNALPGETIDWVSNAPGTASVSGTQVTAGASRGFAQLTASSGVRPATHPTAVSVCQATVVTNGTSLPSAISSADCFSSYGSNQGLPTMSYYADLFRVALTAGQTIVVTMDSGNNLDTYLLMAGPENGYIVAGNDDDPTGILGVGSRMTYTATTTGVHVIEASTFNGLDTGSYTLGVTIN